MPVTSFRRLLVVAACGIPFCGCEVRDEEARAGPSAAWFETMARRLSEGQAAVRGRAATGGVEWVDGFAVGSRRAADGGLPMLLVFRAAWCRWSGDLVDTALAEERMAAVAGRVVCISIDADREPEICRSFGILAFPTVIVLDTERRERFRATGAAARRGLASALEAAVAPPGRRVAELPPPPSR